MVVKALLRKQARSSLLLQASMKVLQYGSCSLYPEGAIPRVPPPDAAVLAEVVAGILANPPTIDPTEQHKPKFRLRIKTQQSGVIQPCCPIKKC